MAPTGPGKIYDKIMISDIYVMYSDSDPLY